MELSSSWFENVLNFNIQAAPGYQGFGQGVLKYPYTFSTYNQLSNTRLISPKTGTLQAGSSETFVIASKDYTSFAIIINGEWNHFVKNTTTGNFELNLTIPSETQTLEISGAAAKSAAHWGLVQYNIVQ